MSLAFVNAFTNEKVFAIAGEEFLEYKGCTVIIRKVLYGLTSSVERCHLHFSGSLRSMGFIPTRCNNDVWIKLNDDGNTYDYICSHIDDFMICSKSAKDIMNKIEDMYTVKGIGLPKYYLGNNYKKDQKGRWCIGYKKYPKE